MSKNKDRAKFALECRAIRLWLADHPNSTSFEAAGGVGLTHAGDHLMKMRGMGIVDFKRHKELDGRIPNRWFVVPQ